jgi:DNA-binding Lrp family transcriptional regulator
LDKLDILILRELTSTACRAYHFNNDFRASFKTIGKKFHVDEDTVKHHVAKLRRLGLWLGWHLRVHPDLLGVLPTSLWLDVPLRFKDDLLGKLKLMDDLIYIWNYVGSLVGVVLHPESTQSLARQVELISRLALAESRFVARIPYPKCTVSLSKVDWEIISSIEGDPRKPYKQIASELGLSTRTVKRRLTRMIEGRALFVVRRTDSKLLEGAISADLLVFYADPVSRAETDRRFATWLDDYLCFAGLWEELGVFRLILPSLHKAHEILRRAKQEQNVRSARIELLQERIEHYELLDEELERKLGASRAGDGAAAAVGSFPAMSNCQIGRIPGVRQLDSPSVPKGGWISAQSPLPAPLTTARAA